MPEDLEKQIINKNNPFLILRVFDLLEEKDSTLLQIGHQERMLHTLSELAAKSQHSSLIETLQIMQCRLQNNEERLKLFKEYELLKVIFSFYALVDENDATGKTVKDAVGGFLWAAANVTEIRQCADRYLNFQEHYLEYGVLGDEKGIPIHFGASSNGEALIAKLEIMLMQIKNDILFLIERNCLMDAINSLLVGCCLESYSRALCDYVYIKRSAVPTYEEFAAQILQDLAAESELSKLFFSIATHVGREIFEKQLNGAPVDRRIYQKSRLTLEHVKRILIDTSCFDAVAIEKVAVLDEQKKVVLHALSLFREFFISEIEKSMSAELIAKQMRRLQIDETQLKYIAPYLLPNEVEVVAYALVRNKSWRTLTTLLQYCPGMEYAFSHKDPVFGETLLHWLMTYLKALRDQTVSEKTNLKIKKIVDVTTLLINKGADPAITDEEGKTPFDRVVYDRNFAMMEILLSKQPELVRIKALGRVVLIILNDANTEWDDKKEFLREYMLSLDTPSFVFRFFQNYLPHDSSLLGRIVMNLATADLWDLTVTVLESYHSINLTSCFDQQDQTLWHFLVSEEKACAMIIKREMYHKIFQHLLGKDHYVREFAEATTCTHVPALQEAIQLHSRLLPIFVTAAGLPYLVELLLHKYSGKKTFATLSEYIREKKWHCVDIVQALRVAFNSRFSSLNTLVLLLSLKVADPKSIPALTLDDTFFRHLKNVLPALKMDEVVSGSFLALYLPERIVSMLSLNGHEIISLLKAINTQKNDFMLNHLMKIFCNELFSQLLKAHEKNSHAEKLFLKDIILKLVEVMLSPDFITPSFQAISVILDCLIISDLHYLIDNYVTKYLPCYIANQYEENTCMGASYYFFHLKFIHDLWSLEEYSLKFTEMVLSHCDDMPPVELKFLIVKLWKDYQQWVSRNLYKTYPLQLWQENKVSRILKELVGALKKAATIEVMVSICEEIRPGGKYAALIESEYAERNNKMGAIFNKFLKSILPQQEQEVLELEKSQIVVNQ